MQLISIVQNTAVVAQIILIALVIVKGSAYVNRLFGNRRRSILSNSLVERQPIGLVFDLIVGVFLQTTILIPLVAKQHHNTTFFLLTMLVMGAIALVVTLIRSAIADNANSRISSTIFKYTIATIVMYITYILYFLIPVIYIIKSATQV